jgi:phage N-6-adenine-methyltransferase
MSLLNLATTKLEEAKLYLAEVRDINVAKELVDQAKTLEFYSRQRNDAAEAQGNAYVLVQHANRALGRLLEELPKAPPGRPKKGDTTPEILPPDGSISSKRDALRTLGISSQDASRMEAMARLPEDEFTKRLKEDRDKRSSASANAATITSTTAASDHDGDAWGTPPEYIELACEVMGFIELDVASNDFAQQTVKADRYYTKEANGLEQSWKCTKGGLWMNQPYSRGLVSAFAEAWCERYQQFPRGGMQLVNSATETAWFQRNLSICTAVLFPKGRLAYIDPATGAPIKNNDHPQALFYVGPKLPLFQRKAKRFGEVFMRA